jgi:hypothetical protein
MDSTALRRINGQAATRPPHDLRVEVEHALGGPGAALLHDIDYQDVSITPEGARMVMRAARTLVERHMPAKDPASLTVRECIALFLDDVFWEERSGGLVLCSALSGGSACLTLPRRCWRVRGVPSLLH